MISNPYLFYYQKIILKIFANINKPQISMLKDPIYLVYLINLYCNIYPRVGIKIIANLYKLLRSFNKSIRKYNNLKLKFIYK
jgi:hypothetical protein